MRTSDRSGVTLVEMLVVVAIVGLLLALLIPAVQSVREAARAATCQNNLRQLGLAMLQHEETYGRFPTGGWGYLWVGDPDRGAGPQQPGGWVFSILPYLEQSTLFTLGRGGTEDEKRESAAIVMQRPQPLFLCPSRRPIQLYPYNEPRPLRNADMVAEAAKSDYAANGGNKWFYIGQGPEDLEEGDSGEYDWGDFSEATGICHERSAVAFRQITDGASSTYMIGEKYRRNLDVYDMGDDQCMYVGHDMDTVRWADKDWPLYRDATVEEGFFSFGSSHPYACHFVFVDGSVHAINYDIDVETHRRLANRKDGLPVDMDDLQEL